MSYHAVGGSLGAGITDLAPILKPVAKAAVSRGASFIGSKLGGGKRSKTSKQSKASAPPPTRQDRKHWYSGPMLPIVGGVAGLALVALFVLRKKRPAAASSRANPGMGMGFAMLAPIVAAVAPAVIDAGADFAKSKLGGKKKKAAPSRTAAPPPLPRERKRSWYSGPLLPILGSVASLGLVAFLVLRKKPAAPARANRSRRRRRRR